MSQNGEMNKEATPFHRKVVLIDKKFQTRFVFTWLGLMFGILVLLGAVFAFGLYNLQGIQQPEIFLLSVRKLMFWNVAAALLIMVLIPLYLIRLSHRIAGPAYHLTQSIKRLRSGDLDFKVVLRNKDYLFNVADELNDWIKELHHKQEVLNEAVTELASVKSALGTDTATEQISSLENKLQSLSKQISSLEGKLRSVSEVPGQENSGSETGESKTNR